MTSQEGELMGTFLIICAGVLLAVAFVSAYYTGKAELTVLQMFKQREVGWCFFVSYLCWIGHDLLGHPYPGIHAFVRFLVFVAVGVLLILVQGIGLKRKQAQRNK